MTSTPRTPARAAPAWVLMTVSIGYAMVVIDTTAVNVALPTISGNLHGSVSQLQWVVDGYVLVFAALLAVGGSIGDRHGPAAVFRAGVVLFGAASAACALSPSLPVLIAARAVQGVGAAMLAPTCLALITQAYAHDDVRRTRATAVFVTAAGSPQAFGPLLGGVLVQFSGWRSIFWINVPIAVVTGALALRLRSTDHPRARLPLLGHAFLLVMIAGLTTIMIEAPHRGITSPLVLCAGAAFLVGTGLLIHHEARAVRPAVARELLRPPTVLYIAVGLLLFAGYYGMAFVISLDVQERLGFDALSTGAVMLAAAIGIFVLPLASSRLVHRFGARKLLLSGLLCVVAGDIFLAAGDVANAGVRESALALLGVGVGLSVTPQITLTMDAGPAEAVSQASGVLNAARQLGTVVGVATLGTIVTVAPVSAASVTIAAAVAAAVAILAVAAVQLASRMHRPEGH